MPSAATLARVRTKSDEAAVDAGCWFDQRSADRVRYFFERFLRHSKGQHAGQRFELLDWQWDNVIAPIYGWKMPDGTRRTRRAGLGIPKKNGKSTLLSGVGLYMLVGDGEAGAEIYSAAADRKQASIIYNEAANMAEASPALSTHLKVRRAAKIIRHPASKSWYEALSAEHGTKEGLNIHCLLFDELHAQPSWNLWNTLRYGFAARTQPLLIWISTAGIYDPSAIGYTQWQYAKDVQSGRIIDISYHAYILEATEDEDWKAEETHRRVNPSYGLTISKRDFEESVQEAVVSPANENTFKRYRLNIWVRQATRWIRMDKWGACARPHLSWEFFRRRRCYVGLDLAATSDIVAAAFVSRGEKPEEAPYYVWPMFWVPLAAMRAREVENRTRLDHWAQMGLLRVTDRTEAVDYDTIRADLLTAAEHVKVDGFCIDPWNATQIATQLQGDGFEVEFVRQGFTSISAASKEFEKLVIAGGLLHPASQVLDWMVGNVATEMNASGDIKPSKRKSAEKIDGVAAIVTALAKFIKTAAPKKSKYEKGKPFVLGGQRGQAKDRVPEANGVVARP